MPSDGTLLKEYAESGAEDAFAELVLRHLDFDYSTALRGVGGDEHLAKDVSQVVFMKIFWRDIPLTQQAWPEDFACLRLLSSGR